CQHCYSTPYSF
nr:immunoglobulin light chain junction region [Macaca mulatta]